MDRKQEALNGMAEALREAEELENELPQNHGPAEHRLRGLAHHWQVDLDEVQRFSQALLKAHDVRVEEITQQVRNGSYHVDSDAVAESLIRTEPAAEQS